MMLAVGATRAPTDRPATDSRTGDLNLPVLVFLAQRSTAEKLALILARASIPAIPCTTPVGLDGAIRSADHALIVTVTQLIGIARSLSHLPIVNLDVFVSRPEGPVGSPGAPVGFDSRGFLRRVRETMEKEASHHALSTAFV